MSSDEEFQEWLRATFREEADEILTGISNGLIDLEKAGTKPDSEIVEQVYRKTHSLKGAARAVHFKEIESICLNLENIFSLMKSGDLKVDDPVFDLIHTAINLTFSLLSGKKDSQSGYGEVIRDLRNLYESCDSDGKGKAKSRNDTISSDIIDSTTPLSHTTAQIKIQNKKNEESQIPDTGNHHLVSSERTQIPEESHDKGNEIKTDLGVDLVSRQTNTKGTVRIAAHKLDRLITSSDDLLTTRLFIDHRLNELDDLLGRFSLWRWNHSR